MAIVNRYNVSQLIGLDDPTIELALEITTSEPVQIDALKVNAVFTNSNGVMVELPSQFEPKFKLAKDNTITILIGNPLVVVGD